MMKSKYILATLLALTAAPHLHAQQLSSAYFTDGFLYAHETNPAAAPAQSYASIPALGNFNVKLQGNFGLGDVILDNPYYGISSNKRLTTFLHPAISVSDALDGFSSGRNRLRADLKLAIASVGFKAFGGYNTVSLSSRSMVGLSLPYELFEMAKNTGNRTYDIGDINVRAQSFAELAFGHSRDLNDQLRVGAKAKLLIGLGDVEVAVKNVKADLASPGQWRMEMDAQANVSVKGFKYETDTYDYKAQDGNMEHVDDVDVDGTGVNGLGVAFDLGAEYKINDDWKVSAALLDLGFISWKNNWQATNRRRSFVFNGFHDISVNEDRDPNTFDNQADSYGDQFTEFLNLQDEGDQGKRTTGIGATLNLGAEYTLPCYKPISFGALSTTRIQGDYTWTEARISANYKPLKWLSGGVNFAVNSFTASMGWILNVHPKGYNFFIGMDHIVGSCSKEMVPLNTNANLAFGMNITW